MHRQTVVIAVETKNGEVQKLGGSAMIHPKLNFKGCSIKWYEDKPKVKQED